MASLAVRQIAASGQSDRFGTRGHKATLHLHPPSAFPAHDQLHFETWPGQKFLCTVSEAHESVT